MKITLAYLPEETAEAVAAAAAIRITIPNVKVKKSDRHPPFKHMYLTTKKAEKACEIKEFTVDTPG